MIADRMKVMLGASSAIRAMFEEGKRLAKIYGKENVYDFSLGNPSVPAPQKVKEAFIDVIEHTDDITLHGYMNNSGFESVRESIAESINKKFGTAFSCKNIVMTVGAAGGLNVVLRAILNPDDEVVMIAPFFGEYLNYVANSFGKSVIVPPNPPTFQPDLEAFEKALTNRTKAVIINTPNNPTGVVYSEETLKKLAEILDKKSKENKQAIYLISDEPYRELAYDGVEVPYVTKYYANTIVGYSYSKSLSLPGERIGYLVIPDEAEDFENLVSACNVATRILGFVNAPSLQQLVIQKCLDETSDISVYDKNRELLYNSLTEYGFECIKPQGAFYLFVKCPIDETQFVEKAKQLRLLLVGGKSFACEGYVRLAYCVSYDTIVNSLPQFRQLANETLNK